jgi:hypothetical protein
MSQDYDENDREEQVMPSSQRDDELTPSLGRYYTQAENELGPDAHHFDVVKRALDLWEHDVKSRENHDPERRPPGADAV